jgi:hypothetical protein
MTWSKKQNTRAYDPIAAVSLTPNAGSVSGVTVDEAYYTVVNDYICLFNAYIRFTQNTSAAASYSIPAPLGLAGASNGPVGGGTLYVLGGGHYPVWIEKDSATTFRVYPVSGTTVPSGASYQLRILGQFAVR